MEKFASNSPVSLNGVATFHKTTNKSDPKKSAQATKLNAGSKPSGTLNNNNASSSAQKRKKQDSKTGKGLRHFSMKVCEKVRQKGTTTYNEVADELVAEFSTDPGVNRTINGNDAEPFDQKNIRRRVYDALNVLMAINIISKEKKEIRWIGLPTNAQQEKTDLEKERTIRLERIQKKKHQLREAIIQQIAFKNLIDRNEDQKEPTDPNSVIKLPFIIVNTDKNTMIDCSISRDRSEYLFNFDNTFEIHDDIEVLKRMGLAHDLEKPGAHVQMTASDYKKALNFISDHVRPSYEEMIKEKNVEII